MATVTKPRKGATHTALSDGDQLADAKRIAQAARRKANAIAKDESVNRSTRTRQALKVKAEALDRIAALK